VQGYSNLCLPCRIDTGPPAFENHMPFCPKEIVRGLGKRSHECFRSRYSGREHFSLQSSISQWQHTNSAKHICNYIRTFCLATVFKALENIAWDTKDKDLGFLPECEQIESKRILGLEGSGSCKCLEPGLQRQHTQPGGPVDNVFEEP